MNSYEDQATHKTNQIINSVCFPAAADEYVQRYLKVIRGYQYSVKLTSDEGRYLITLKQAASLMAPQREEDRSARHLQRYAKLHQLADKSRIYSWLALAQKIGFVTVEPSVRDRRMKLYFATDHFIHFANDVFDYYAQPLAIIDPAKYGIGLTPSPRVLGEMARNSLEVYLEGRRYVDLIRGLDVFARRDGGYQILMRLVEESRLFSDTPNQTLSLPFNALAKEFSLSRSQIQKSFAAIEAAGFVKLLEPGGRTVQLSTAFKPFATEVIASMLATAAVAFDRVILQQAQAHSSDADLALPPAHPLATSCPSSTAA